MPTSIGTRSGYGDRDVIGEFAEQDTLGKFASSNNFSNGVSSDIMTNIPASNIIQVYFAVWVHDVVQYLLLSSLSSTLVVSVIRPPGSASASWLL